MVRRPLALVLVGAFTVAGCATVGGSTSPPLATPPAASPSSVATEPTTTPDVSPSEVAQTPAPRTFSAALDGNNGDRTTATITDRSGLIRSVDPWVVTPSNVPGPQHLLPTAVNPGDERSSLLVFWGQLGCRTETDLFVDTLATGLLITIAPVGSGDCDTIGSVYAARLVLNRGVDATDVAARQVHEALGGIEWVARTPSDEGDTVQIVDRALALTSVKLDVPPRVTAGTSGLAQSNQGREVSIAWEQPCGSEPHLALDGTPQSAALRIVLHEVSACAGSITRGVTLTFVEEQGAADLSIDVEGP